MTTKLTLKDITPQNVGLALFPYQAVGVKWLLTSRYKRKLLADQPGLGKSPQVIVASNAICPTYTIIICPAVVKGVWRYEWERWSTLKNKNVHTIKSKKDVITAESHVVIVSLDTAKQPKRKRELKELLKQPNTLLVIDEAHQCRGYNTQRSKVLSDLSTAASRTWLLTGTPMLKAVGDLYPFIQVCEGGLGKRTERFHEFCYQYSFAYPTPFGTGVEYRGVRNAKELRHRLSRFMLRRYKKDVLPDLPKKLYHMIPVDIGRNTAEFTVPIQEISKLLEGQISTEANNYPALRKALGITKLPMMLEWLDLFYETHGTETPAIVFANHKTTIQGLEEYYRKKLLPFGTISGATPANERTKIVADFQTGKIQAIILNIIAGGVGITLTRADHVIFAELDWTPANLSQAVDRVHRIGREEPVNIYFLLAENTLEEDMFEMIKMKLEDVGKVM